MVDKNKQLEKLADGLEAPLKIVNKELKEIQEKKEGVEKELKATETQLINAKKDLVFIKGEIEAEGDTLAKIKKDCKEKLDTEKDKLVKVQLVVQDAEKEHSRLLSETASERRKIAKGLADLETGTKKLEEIKNTAQSVIDTKKEYLAMASREKKELLEATAKANSAIGSADQLNKRMQEKDAELKTREIGLKGQEADVSERQAIVSKEKQRLSALEASLNQRDASLKKDEDKVTAIKVANDEKETHLVQYEEKLRQEGYKPPKEEKAKKKSGK